MPWFWEGNVQSIIAKYLIDNGFRIIRMADTKKHSPGIDIIAKSPFDKELLITVKGYPEEKPEKASHPSSQAVHWFAGAIYDIVVYHGQKPDARLGLGLPDGYRRYINLAKKILWLLKDLGLVIYWVDEHGHVRVEGVDEELRTSKPRPGRVPFLDSA